MKEEWLMPGAVVPVDVETTAALVVEIKRLIGLVGGMALNQQRPWAGLTNGEMIALSNEKLGSWDLILEVEDKLKGRNT